MRDRTAPIPTKHLSIDLTEQWLANSEIIVTRDCSGWVSEIYLCVLFPSCGSNSGKAISHLALYRFVWEPRGFLAWRIWGLTWTYHTCHLTEIWKGDWVQWSWFSPCNHHGFMDQQVSLLLVQLNISFLFPLLWGRLSLKVFFILI